MVLQNKGHAMEAFLHLIGKSLLTVRLTLQGRVESVETLLKVGKTIAEGICNGAEFVTDVLESLLRREVDAGRGEPRGNGKA